MTTTTTRKPRGFAAMAPDVLRSIASAGGKAAHAKGVAREFTADEAKAAGRKGGQTTAARRANRKFQPGDDARTQGRKGGLKAQAKARASRAQAAGPEPTA